MFNIYADTFRIATRTQSHPEAPLTPRHAAKRRRGWMHLFSRA